MRCDRPLQQSTLNQRDSIAPDMGLFSRKIAESRVWFSGIQEYADSGDEEFAISAQVEISEHGQIGGKEPLPMFGPLGAARLLSMLRRESHYVIPFMTLADAVATNLLDKELDLAEFSVRGSVLTDPELLAIMVGASSSSGGPGADDSMRTAELNGSLPIVAEQLPDTSERSTTLELHEARNGMGSVRFKFPMGSSNALTTIGAWAATVDYLATQWPRQEMATPIGAGLRGLKLIWEKLGHPLDVSVRQGAEIEALISEAVASNTPD